MHESDHPHTAGICSEGTRTEKELCLRKGASNLPAPTRRSEIYGSRKLSALMFCVCAAAIALQRLASCGNGKVSAGICVLCSKL